MLSNEINTDGVNLSGGENQKLSITRAIYKDTDLLIMDEPSSALDPFSEEQLYKTIDEISRSKTLIIVSHRLSCVKSMDRILFFENEKSSKTAPTNSL